MNDTEIEINDDSIARVRRNDATVTSLSTNNNRFTDQVADSLGRALQRNTHVTRLSLEVYNLTYTGNYNSLLTAIEQSTTLEEIELEGTRGIERVADRFLDAMSSTRSIRKVELHDLGNLGTNAFMSLLHSPVSDLTINNCTFADTSQEACRELTAGLRDNVSLQRFKIIDMENELTVMLLNAIRLHPAIRHLTVEPLELETEVMVATSDGIGHVLSSSSTLTSLELCCFGFLSASIFETILQGLRSNQGVNTLKLATNDFDYEATDMFVSLFHSDRCIHTLNMYGVDNGFYDATVGEVVSRILRKNDTLENLNVEEFGDGVELILEALQNNATLKTLTFVNSLDDADLKSLQRNLPKLRGLKKLTFSISGRVRISVESLLQSFEGNGSLEEVEIFQDGGFELFNAEALAKIRSFCRRNKKLPSFLAAPVDPVIVSPSRGDSRDSSNDGNSHDGEAFSDPVLNLRLRPKAYFVAQKIEEGGNRMIFHDLMRLGDLIGGGE